jgi:DNA polymerase-3 subunit delta
MTAIRPPALDAFLRKPDPAVVALLIYGEDGEAVRELAQRAVTRIAGAHDDPFAVAALGEADLAADPARLADEAQSISMFGGARSLRKPLCWPSHRGCGQPSKPVRMR